MKLDKITRKLAEAFTSSIQLAEGQSNSEQTEEHLIFTILNDTTGMAEILFAHLNFDRTKFKILPIRVFPDYQKFKELSILSPLAG